MENGDLVQFSLNSLLNTFSLNVISNGIILRGLNGAILRGLNGSILRGPNGAILRGANGAILRGLNGAILKGPNSAILRGANGIALGADAIGNNTGVILDSKDAIDNGTGYSWLGSMFGINMITGLNVGKQYLVPGVLVDPNFDISYGLAEVVIGKAPLTIKADDKTRKYGENNPVLTVSYNGFVNGENLMTSGIKGADSTGMPSSTTTASQYSPVSPPTYPITVGIGTLAPSSNYAYSFVNGLLTITPNQCLITHDPTNFVSTANARTATSLWLNVTVKVSGQLVTNGDYLIFRTGGITLNSVTSNPTVTEQAIPNGRIVADNSVSSPVTNYDGATNTWITKVPLGYSSTSDIFITGAIINSSTGFAAINSKANSVLKGMFYTNRTFSDQWSYAMGAYQPQFNYDAISAQGAITSINGTYRAGTPTTVLRSIVGGGTGNGGNNFTGSPSNQNAFTACIPSSFFDVNRAMLSLSTIKPELIGAVNKEIMDVYPNPSTDNIRLSVVPAITGRSKITLLTIDGKTVLEINNGVTEAGRNYVKNIDVSKLPSGMYIIQLITGYKTTIKKVIITR